MAGAWGASLVQGSRSLFNGRSEIALASDETSEVSGQIKVYANRKLERYNHDTQVLYVIALDSDALFSSRTSAARVLHSPDFGALIQQFEALSLNLK